ncbi:ATP-binding protein [Allonocardiopsis opalescens]|uniref:Histidine kinase-like protein n=1 Tax=Allonocardiopsis opalescens TaxID=1144618 RepID=A0A2T0Q7A2_9ACTN|nr:ATP-binding protein [Allonocardiopsis opalescens]PRX99661.1 histidine kinase-like protein [Allonocardiopsis opalescens]
MSRGVGFPQAVHREAVGHQTCQRTFAGTFDQVAAVRDFVHAHLPPGEAREDAKLVASELATNAIQHTQSGSPSGVFTVKLACGSHMIRVEVTDEGSPLPILGPTASTNGEHGRGLAIVAAVACEWGWAGHFNERTVWAEMNCE